MTTVETNHCKHVWQTFEKTADKIERHCKDCKQIIDSKDRSLSVRYRKMVEESKNKQLKA